VQDAPAPELSAEQRQEVAAWIEKNSDRLPEAVRIFLALHQKYLAAGADVRRRFETAWRELRRALGITPSSERRRSGNPLSVIPPDKGATAKSKQAWLEQQHARSVQLGDWHKELKKRHHRRAKRLKAKLAEMAKEQTMEQAPQLDIPPLDDFERTEEEKAEDAAAAEVFAQHLELGSGADPVLKSVNETLMPGGAVLANVEQESVSVEMPEDLSRAEVLKTLTERRVRYDFSVTVKRIELDVEKKVVEHKGERRVLAASTRDFGPPWYAVTWSALATLAVMVGQFALPFHRLATMLSTAAKRFTAGSLSRMLHYVAERFVPVYLELVRDLANSEILSGDDTSCRVLEVASYLAEIKAGQATTEKQKPPWAGYQTPKAAEGSFRRCEAAREARVRRREDGDREARRTPEETAPLGVLIGRELIFESPRRDGSGSKALINTTVVSGRSIAKDPRSLIVFYRSHIGGCGNLLESILRHRDKKARDVVLQTDLSTTNLVTAPDLLSRFRFKLIGCSAHARRPFANYEHEDPVNCSYMLHLFCGLAIHEQRLDVHGRNRQNVLAVRQAESRELWQEIKELAQTMTSKWSPATKLGAGARYIIKHYDKLTAYLDDPRFEATNNLRERMLRTEKLIEGSSLFRRSLEGRFALDIVRTILQTAVAAGVPVHAYVESVLRADPEDVAKNPERFTPHAWSAAHTRNAAA
jgi:hypothetical protein